MIGKLKELRSDFRALKELLDDAEKTHKRAREAIERYDETSEKANEAIRRSRELLSHKPK